MKVCLPEAFHLPSISSMVVRSVFASASTSGEHSTARLSSSRQRWYPKKSPQGDMASISTPN